VKNFDIISADFRLLCARKTLRPDRVFDVLYLPVANCNTFVTHPVMKHGTVYCKSKMYSHSSSWMLSFWFRVRGY
jgi:hypothetical protein